MYLVTSSCIELKELKGLILLTQDKDDRLKPIFSILTKLSGHLSS